ncbi:1-aminocyclopropane-1-carboxylate oxidase homolog 1-like [Camellia sinensis]|uniref:1-aminocyclopropane-1-carboxylate oxidase homolog 1-like n=1 Tax=Camellia sinensis TaxID=4442 RepID=UPI001035F74E|nr:1-aminocyclopropane-1-carboxylate oxidase homolog 1-like [Camellia sinensis]
MDSLSRTNNSFTETRFEYDPKTDLKAFDETKAGVKGLVDAGVVKIPKIFIRPSNDPPETPNSRLTNLQVPMIDLGGIDDRDRRDEIVDEIRRASEEWGFFQVVNHGIPFGVLSGMIDGVRKFNEQDLEAKKEFYTRDRNRKVRFNSNFDLYHAKAANWRDTLTISMAVPELVPEELPSACSCFHIQRREEARERREERREEEEKEERMKRRWRLSLSTGGGAGGYRLFQTVLFFWIWI